MTYKDNNSQSLLCGWEYLFSNNGDNTYIIPNDYWNNMVLPSDKEFAQMLDMSKRMNWFMLYKKLGHDKFNAFMVRLLEDNPMEYDEYYSKPSMDYLPF